MAVVLRFVDGGASESGQPGRWSSFLCPSFHPPSMREMDRGYEHMPGPVHFTGGETEAGFIAR